VPHTKVQRSALLIIMCNGPVIYTDAQQFNSMQFIPLSIYPLQGVNHKDVENSHIVHQNIQSSSIKLKTV
jgi:hypothetical protein